MPDNIDTIQEFLDDAHEAAQRAGEELEELERQKAEVQALLEDLRAEQAGLKLLLKRHVGAPADGHPKPQGVSNDEPQQHEVRHELLDMARTDAIGAVLRSNPQGLSPADIRDELARHGRKDEYQLVSAALSYLKKQGRVRSPKRGHYLAVDQEASE